MTRSQKSYSDDEKSNALAALAANGGNIGKTARQLSIPRKTLERWANGGVPDRVAQSGRLKRGHMADTLDEIAWQVADSLPAKIPDATLSQAATTLGIVIDKSRLLRGQPTTVNFNVYASMSREELERELASLRSEQVDLITRNGSSPPLAIEGTPAAGAELPA